MTAMLTTHSKPQKMMHHNQAMVSTRLKLLLAGLTAATALVLTGCQTPSTTATNPSTVAKPMNPQPMQNQPIALTGKVWRVSQSSVNGLTGVPFEMRFEDGRVAISGGCNSMSGEYKLAVDTLTVGNMASTRMMCAPNLMQADDALATFMAQPMTVMQVGNKLHLTNTLGQVVLEGAATLRAQYGEPTIQYLMVAPERVTCYAGGTRQCLQVKEVRYDDQGVKTYVGSDWMALPSEIEGYSPQDGETQIIRVARYQTPANRPAGMPQYLYEYEMTVESAAS